MCGRVAQHRPSAEFAERFGAEDQLGDGGGRYNVAPTDPISVIVQRDGRRALTAYRWGLVPPWAASPKGGARMINARAETVATSPAFRGPFRSRRCVIPVDGFYEWLRRPDGSRQPYHIAGVDGSPLALAGLWSSWRDPGTDGLPLRTCAIITTTPNVLFAKVHDRMPVILGPEQWPLWLDSTLGDQAELIGLLEPHPTTDLVAFPVGSDVNNVRHDGPALVIPTGSPLA